MKLLVFSISITRPKFDLFRNIFVKGIYDSLEGKAFIELYSLVANTTSSEIRSTTTQLPSFLG